MLIWISWNVFLSISFSIFCVRNDRDKYLKTWKNKTNMSITAPLEVTYSLWSWWIVSLMYHSCIKECMKIPYSYISDNPWSILRTNSSQFMYLAHWKSATKMPPKTLEEKKAHFRDMGPIHFSLFVIHTHTLSHTHAHVVIIEFLVLVQPGWFPRIGVVLIIYPWMCVCVRAWTRNSVCVCVWSDKSHIYYMDNRPPQVVFLGPPSDPSWYEDFGKKREKRRKRG